MTGIASVSDIMRQKVLEVQSRLPNSVNILHTSNTSEKDYLKNDRTDDMEGTKDIGTSSNQTNFNTTATNPSFNNMLKDALTAYTMSNMLGNMQLSSESESSNPYGLGSDSNLLTGLMGAVGLSNITNNIMKTGLEKNYYISLVEQSANKYGIDPTLAKSVAKAESNFNPNVVSKAGAMGIMQLMPATAKGLGVTDPFDPMQNIDGGIRYISYQLQRYNGDMDMALAAYNCGPNRLKNLGITDLNDPTQFSKLPKETQNYINKIHKYMDEF